MLDLRVLRDRWTEEGARTVFAQLVTQCVKSIYPSAREIRPNPGDEGIDSFVGNFDGDTKVYQSKYFCDCIGDSQKKNIRESFNTCVKSTEFSTPVLWTLCVPIDLDIREEKWWQNWKQKKIKEHGFQIELWSKTDFVRFRAQPDLKPIFNFALNQVPEGIDLDTALVKLKTSLNSSPIKKLPSKNQFQQANFVKKLEKADIHSHLAARTAFYNFELLRTAITESGIDDDIYLLEELQVKILDLWEKEYHKCNDEDFGKKFYLQIMEKIENESSKSLKTSLQLDTIFKKGGMHYWTDLCEAGWVKDYDNLV
jgi:hypothetical protein